MTAELAVVTNPDEIANLPAEQRGQLITRALVESKQWLAVATKGTDPTPIAEFKAWAATVAEMTKQKGLAEDIQLDALEMVRRAERGIGMAIRNGQQAGTMAKRGDIGGCAQSGTRGAASGSSRAEDLDRPSDFFSGGGAQAETYAMTDDVSDEHFEEALDYARSEGNLTRRNVVRKLTPRSLQGKEPARVSFAARREEIEEWARNGATTRQIVERLGVSMGGFGRFVRGNGIDIPADRVVGKTRLIDPERIVREVVNSLEGIRYSLNLLTADDYDAFTAEQIADWLEALKGPNRAVRDLMKELTARA